MLLQTITKLRLEPGDIVVVKYPEQAMALERLGQVVPFKVPLVVCPDGIEKLSRQDMLNILEQLEEPLTVDEYSQTAGSPAPL